MVRIKRSIIAINSRQTILQFVKGFKGSYSKLFRITKGQMMKALKYSYSGRKNCKQNFKKIWVCRINAYAHIERIFYKKLISYMKLSSYLLNKKIFAQLLFLDPYTFKRVTLSSE